MKADIEPIVQKRLHSAPCWPVGEGVLLYTDAFTDYRRLLCELHPVGTRKGKLLQHHQAVLQSAEIRTELGIKARMQVEPDIQCL